MDKDTIDKLKENIKKLVEQRQLVEAKVLLESYQKIIKVDADIYSIMGVISMLEGDIDEAKRFLEEGLKISTTNYDLMFNLAYVYELKKDYLKALISYRKVLREHYYVVDRTEIEERIEEVKKHILQENSDEFSINVAKLDKILFIDFDNNEKINDLANKLSNYGISVDIAYSGTSPLQKLSNNKNPYRKILPITNLDDFVDYAKYYNYDSIHSFSAPEKIEIYLRKMLLKFNTESIYNKTDSQLIKIFTQSIVRISKEYINGQFGFTILLLTYNRPLNFSDIITGISNYKHLKPKVIVVDSSEFKNREIHKKIIQSLGEKINIEYVEVGPENTFKDKVGIGIYRVKTEFFAICPDDDFFAEEGLIESLNILTKQQDVFTVKGKNLCFINSKSNLFEYERTQTLDQKCMLERLKAYTENFAFVMTYQVFRKNLYIDFYNFIKKNNENIPSNPVFIEYLCYFLFIMTGKVIKINVDLNIRNKGIPREFTLSGNFDDAVINNTFNENYFKMKNIMKEYALFLNLKIDDSDIDIVFNNFLINFLRIPKEFIDIKNNNFNMIKLEQGMRKSWVWKRA